jgi:hypothetical protein
MIDKVEDPYSQASHDLLFSRTLMGKECQACRRVLPWSVFDRDSSKRDGRKLICPKCEHTPKLSTEENTARIRESNWAGTANQRRSNEEDFLDRDPIGRAMYSIDFISKIKKLGISVIAGDAHFADEISLYIQNGQVENGHQYIGWIKSGLNQEFSEYDYNEYSVPVWEIEHGYRGVLKNLIVNGYLTEQKCNEAFGHCDEKVWAKAMFDFRNRG